MSDEDKSLLPATQGDDFVAEFHKGTMDLTKFKDKSFIVAINTGNRNKYQLLGSSIHGPYDFYEMIEQVGAMYSQEQHHAKPVILNKDSEAPVEFLDSGTIDYIENFWMDIITEEILEAACVSYTCEGGTVTEEKEDETREGEE